MSSRPLIAALPKTDLHLHLVGSASIDTVLELARRRPDAGVPTQREQLERFYAFTDFAHFIDVYHAVDRLVREPGDLTALVVGAARDAAASNVRWAEITVTAETHLAAGIAGADIREALEEGRRIAAVEHGVQLGWIVDVSGERGLSAADETIQFLQDHAPQGTVAIGLAGLEAGVPRAQFADHVRAARDLGYRAVIHAGEASGPEAIWSALDDLGADRIGHGIRSVFDTDLLRRLISEQIPLEVCVTSNLCTNVVPDLARHPVRHLLKLGANVVLATDDPGMFSTTLDREYELVAGLTDAGDAELLMLARAGIEASFAPAALRGAMLAELGQVGVRATA